jgi:hypothetical protein
MGRKKLPTCESPTTSTATSDLTQFADREDAMQFLRQANARLSRQLAEAKARNTELAEVVYQAARDAAASLSLATSTSPTVTTTTASDASHDETALICVSDLQLAKITKSYNSDVCAARMRLYSDKVDSLTAIQRSNHPVHHARLYLLGDIVEGELIFPYQPYAIDSSLYKQVMLDGPKILGDFLQRLLATFETVHVVGVIGNHGQIGGQSRKHHNPTTNADRMLYRFLQEIYREEPRVTFHIPDRERERDWYAVDYPVGPDHGFLLFHGDQIRGGFAGFPYYGFAKKVWGWRGGAIKEPFRYAVAGHWHTPLRTTINAVTVWVNGSTESDNTWAQENLQQMGDPTQLLMFVHPKVGVTAEYWVYL